MDKGQNTTDNVLKDAEDRINSEYKQAIEGIEAELNDYLARFELKDKKWQEWVKDGKKTEQEYRQWRIGQMAVGKRWSDLQESIAEGLYEVNEASKSYIMSVCPEVFAENYNFSAYEIEKGAGVNTSFTTYNKEAVQRLIEDNPEVLPPVGKKVAKDIAEGKAVKWNKQQLQSVMIQGILQGDSIPKLATRLANTVGDRDRKAAIRNARTMAIGAQNAGRVEAYKRMEKEGVKLKQMWVAVKDERTRHSHRQLDGEVQPVGEAFSNGCKFPADPAGRPEEIYNCRCKLRSVIEGLEPRAYKYLDESKMGGMSYEEWKEGKGKSQDILHQDKVSKAMRSKHAREYGGVGGGKPKAKERDIIKTESKMHQEIMHEIKANNVAYNEVKALNKPLSDDDIIKKIAGGDKTKGSCSSLTYAYIGNKHGLDVRDFRGGISCDVFSSGMFTQKINKLDGVKTQVYRLNRECKDLAKLLKDLNLEYGKEYRLSCGQHAAIIRNTANGYEYLELQSATKSGWHLFTKHDTCKLVRTDSGVKFEYYEEDCTMETKLYERFRCRKSPSNFPIIQDDGTFLMDDKGRFVYGEPVELTEVDSFADNDEFKEILGYINTDESKQKKGASGHEK